MELRKLIHFYKYVDTSLVKNYNLIYRNTLWYLLCLTHIKRINSKASLKEFFIRYFLIVDLDLSKIALNFVDNDILIEAENDRNGCVLITLNEIVKFMGIEICEEEYTIIGELEYFIENYKFIPSGRQFGGCDLSLNFKDALKTLNKNEIESVIQFVNFLMTYVEDDVFKGYAKKFPETVNLYKERLLIK
jgi:hypothetical protein